MRGLGATEAARYPDEVDAASALLMVPDAGSLTGSGFLLDGGVTAACCYGDVAEVRHCTRASDHQVAED